MSTKFFNILRFTILGMVFVFTTEWASAKRTSGETWYICAKGDWSQWVENNLSCGWHEKAISPNASVTQGVRWSYKKCDTFQADTVPHERDVNQGNFTDEACELK